MGVLGFFNGCFIINVNGKFLFVFSFLDKFSIISRYWWIFRVEWGFDLGVMGF